MLLTTPPAHAHNLLLALCISRGTALSSLYTATLGMVATEKKNGGERADRSEGLPLRHKATILPNSKRNQTWIMRQETCRQMRSNKEATPSGGTRQNHSKSGDRPPAAAAAASQERCCRPPTALTSTSGPSMAQERERRARAQGLGAHDRGGNLFPTARYPPHGKPTQITAQR